MAQTLEGREQVIAQGPVAALEFIKNLGTNGGGFFNANGAHPYENPTPLTNFLALLAIAVLPASFPITFGAMVGRPRAGWALLAVMVVLFVAGLVVCDLAEQLAPAAAWRPGALRRQHGGEGGAVRGRRVGAGRGGHLERGDRVVQRDARLVPAARGAGAAGQHAARRGHVRRPGDRPLQPGDGGPGGDLHGRADDRPHSGVPGQDDQDRGGEADRLVHPADAAGASRSLTAWAVATGAGRAGLVTNGGSRGFTEILFAYASCMANNGQTMAGLNANSPFYNLTTAVAMAAGRFGLAALALALAGRFAAQARKPETIGSMPCDTPTFGVLVLGTVVLVGALCFLPALALGPIAEHLHP